MMDDTARGTAPDQLYDLYYNPATPHGAATWAVFGPDFGLRCFTTKEQAVAEAEAHFGSALFTIRVWPNRTQLRVLAAPGADPATILDLAISALTAERAALENCPIHQAKTTVP